MRRMLFLARALPKHLAGKRVALVTHAASVALVAALGVAPDLGTAGKLDACGAAKLTIAADGIPRL